MTFPEEGRENSYSAGAWALLGAFGIILCYALLSVRGYAGGLGCDGIRAPVDIETDKHCRNGIQGEKRKYPGGLIYDVIYIRVCNITWWVYQR